MIRFEYIDGDVVVNGNVIEHVGVPIEQLTRGNDSVFVAFEFGEGHEYYDRNVASYNSEGLRWRIQPAQEFHHYDERKPFHDIVYDAERDRLWISSRDLWRKFVVDIETGEIKEAKLRK